MRTTGHHNPATGETYFFDEDRSNPPDVFCLERHQEPGGEVAVHVHPLQEERFEVLEGEIVFRIDGEDHRCTAGDVIVVPAGARHAPRTEGEVVSRAYIELRPALNIRGFFETFSALARDGRTTRTGVPRNPLQLAVVGHEFRDEVGLGGLPLPLQRAFAATFAGLGRRLGYVAHPSERTVR